MRSRRRRLWSFIKLYRPFFFCDIKVHLFRAWGLKSHPLLSHDAHSARAWSFVSGKGRVDAMAKATRSSERRGAPARDAPGVRGGSAVKKKAANGGPSVKKQKTSSASQWHPLPVRLDHGSAFTRHLFLRQPSKNAAGASEGRALFVAAVPPDWSERHLIELMETFGEVEDGNLVVLDAAPDAAGGLVTFRDAKSAMKALQAAVRGGTPVDPPRTTGALAVGLEAWVSDFRHERAGPITVQTRIDKWFETFELEEQKKANDAAASASQDHGWTVVEAKRGRRKTTDGDTITVGGIRAATAEGRKKTTACPSTNENFYRFQAREKRRGELYELKAKFSVDKERVAKLKASRKFRPS